MPVEIESMMGNILIVFIVVFVLSMYGFFLIDKIVKHLYESYRSEWVRAGKPCGMFFYPEKTRNINSMLAMQKNAFIWLFRTPFWMKSDMVLLSYLKKLRYSVIISNLGMLLLFVYVALAIQGVVDH